MHGPLFYTADNGRPATDAHVAGWPMPIWRPDLQMPAAPAGFPRAIAYPPQPVFPSAFTFQPPLPAPVNPGWGIPHHFIPLPFETYRRGVLASSTAVSAAISATAPPTFPYVHEVVRPKRRQGCTMSPLEKPFFESRPMKPTPPSAMVTTGPRWLDEHELNISWCVIPAPKATWPTCRTTEPGASPSINFNAGASPSVASEQDCPHLMSVSDFLSLDYTLDAASPPASSPPFLPSSSPSSSPLSSLPKTPRITGHLPLGQRHSTPRSSANSSDDEPLMATVRKKVSLPRIATLNLPKPPLDSSASPPSACARPIAGRRPVNVEGLMSESSSGESTGSGSMSSSSMSPFSTQSPSEMEVDELADDDDDDDDDYLPHSASSSKRKASPERPSQLPRKRGPPPRNTHHCDECWKVFYCDKHYNSHKATHARKRGKKAKAFHCPECNKGFGRISDLRRHQVIHLEEEMIVPCNYCDCVYTRKDALVRHLRIAGNKGKHPPPPPPKKRVKHVSGHTECRVAGIVKNY